MYGGGGHVRPLSWVLVPLDVDHSVCRCIAESRFFRVVRKNRYTRQHRTVEEREEHDKVCRAVPSLGWRTHPLHLDGRAGMARTESKYDPEIEKQIQLQQQAVMQVQLAVAKAQEAEQETDYSGQERGDGRRARRVETGSH